MPSAYFEARDRITLGEWGEGDYSPKDEGRTYVQHLTFRPLTYFLAQYIEPCCGTEMERPTGVLPTLPLLWTGQLFRVRGRPFHSQEWSISNFPCSLARNITSHSMKNLAFLAYSDGRLLYYTNSDFLTYTFSERVKCIVQVHHFQLQIYCWFQRGIFIVVILDIRNHEDFQQIARY